MATAKLWTVVRFPSGSWSYGGSPEDPAYSECEIYRIPAFTAKQAVRKAQSKRSRDLKKQRQEP